MGVNLGNGYLTRKTGAEIVLYLSRSMMLKKVTEAINGSEIWYDNILNDWSSLVKTVSENELFFVKSAPTGVPNFAVLSVEEVVEVYYKGLKAALDHSMEKVGITINWSDKWIGMCSGGARVNIAMQPVIKEQIGNRYMLVLCPNHKIELAICGTFDLSNLNVLSETNLTKVCYLFAKQVYDGDCSSNKQYFRLVL